MWKDVKGYEGVYEINELGQVRRVETKKILKAAIAKNGYYIVSLWKNNKGKSHYTHRMLAEVFLNNDNPKLLRTVNHKDGNKLNNDLDNLEWVSYSYNNKHAYETGLKVVSDKVRENARKNAIIRNKRRGLKNGN